MRTIKMLLCLAALASFGAAASGCHTSEGFGKDVESSGKAIKEAAQ
jgi:predicted small secreted protein